MYAFKPETHGLKIQVQYRDNKDMLHKSGNINITRMLLLQNPALLSLDILLAFPLFTRVSLT